MSKLIAKGQYVVIETTNTKVEIADDFSIDSELDDSNRYLKGLVHSAGEGTGLKGGETVLYDKKNTFGTRLDSGKLYQVCLAHNVIGIIEE